MRSVVCAVCVCALTAGYLHGGAATLNLLKTDSTGYGYWAAYVVASALWLVVNLAVPTLILCLSKLLAGLISLYISIEPTAEETEPTMPYVGALAQHADDTTERASLPIIVAMPGMSEPVRDKACPKCSRQLTAGQMGAAKRYGYCKACKGM